MADWLLAAALAIAALVLRCSWIHSDGQADTAYFRQPEEMVEA